MEHLAALKNRLANEKFRFSKDNSTLRKVWIEQIEKEIAKEVQFLEALPVEIAQLSDDDLIKELLS